MNSFLKKSLQQLQQRIDMNTLVRETEKQERKWLMRRWEVYDSNMLNEMKVKMAQLEWYKKCSEDKGIGYYDCYKNASDRSDLVVEKHKKFLTCYWIDTVDEVAKKPQRNGAAFTTRWLFAGTNYRRMIEPLDIAEYYRDRKTDYETKGRSKHYKQLEQWLEEDEKNASRPNNSKKQNLAGGLTEDSCFWANVEEALISCEVLTKRESKDMDTHKQILIEFEDYVWGMIENKAVSHEILLKGSSYMKWWEEYSKIIQEGIMGTSYTSSLTDFMKKKQLKQYATGCLQIG
jgi:hypothetical protein